MQPRQRNGNTTLFCGACPEFQPRLVPGLSLGLHRRAVSGSIRSSAVTNCTLHASRRPLAVLPGTGTWESPGLHNTAPPMH